MKPPPPGPEKYINYPLLVTLLLLVVGLGLVLANLSTNNNVSLLMKSAGPILVMTGLTTMLLRILFSYTPSVLHAMCRGKHKGGNPVDNLKNNSRVACEIENIATSQDFRSR